MARRSKFAIDFNQDKKTVARLVLADLLRKHPRGASGKLSKDDYGWDRTPHMCRRDAASREGVGIWCGYTEDQMVELFIRSDAPLSNTYSLREAIEKQWYRERYPNKSEAEIQDCYCYVPDATMTRRMERIEGRIRSVRREISERGRPGIYKIDTGYRSSFTDVPFYVWANNTAEATGQFNTLTKPLLAAADSKFSMDDHVSVRQNTEHYDLSPDNLLEYSQRTIDEMGKLENRLQTKINELTAQLEGLQGIKDMVTDMAVNSIMASEQLQIMIDAVILAVSVLLESANMAVSTIDVLFLLTMACVLAASFACTFTYVGVEWIAKKTKKKTKSMILNWVT